MKKSYSLFLILTVVCAYVNSSAAQSKSPDEWDIMGVKLGTTSEQAMSALKTNVPNVIFSQNLSKVATFRGNGAIGTFRLPATFGAEVTIKGSPDNMLLAYDPLDPKHKVLAVRRHFEFRTNAPSVKSVLDSLIEKYGKYDAAKDNTVFYWLPTVLEKDRTAIQNNPPCQDFGIQWIGARGGPFGEEINYGSAGWTGTEISTICGKFLKVSINVGNSGLVYAMDFLLADTTALRASYDTIGKKVKEGEEADMAKERAQGDQVKPKF